MTLSLSKEGYTDEWLDNGTNNSPLSVNLSNRSNGEGMDIDYDFQIDALDEEGIYHLHETIFHVLNHMIEQPESQIKDIEVVNGEERETILNDFNDSSLALNNDTTFVQRFEQQVAQHPNKTAVTFEGESLTYEALNGKVNQMARQLRL